MPQAEADREPAQGQPADALLDVTEFGALAAQKLAPGRHVEEQIAHVDRRSDRMRSRNRLADGFVQAYAPSTIQRLDIRTGDLETACEDAAFDFMAPQVDGEGRLYCIRKPYGWKATPART